MARLFAACLMAGGLSACDLREFDGFNNFPQFGESAPAEAIERRKSASAVELILHPVPVWDEVGASSPQTILADGREFSARRRDSGFLERPFARAGLFWHSRLDYIFLPIVVLGPPAEIRRAEIQAGASRALLRRAEDNFQFTPARAAGGGEASSAVFQLKPQTLRAVAAADTVRLIVATDRGVLNLGLDVVDGDSPDEYRRNARVLFARFAAKMAAEGG